MGTTSSTTRVATGVAVVAAVGVVGYALYSRNGPSSPHDDDTKNPDTVVDDTEPALSGDEDDAGPAIGAAPDGPVGYDNVGAAARETDSAGGPGSAEGKVEVVPEKPPSPSVAPAATAAVAGLTAPSPSPAPSEADDVASSAAGSHASPAAAAAAAADGDAKADASDDDATSTSSDDDCASTAALFYPGVDPNASPLPLVSLWAGEAGLEDPSKVETAAKYIGERLDVMVKGVCHIQCPLHPGTIGTGAAVAVSQGQIAVVTSTSVLPDHVTACTATLTFPGLSNPDGSTVVVRAGPHCSLYKLAAGDDDSVPCPAVLFLESPSHHARAVIPCIPFPARASPEHGAIDVVASCKSRAARGVAMRRVPDSGLDAIGLPPGAAGAPVIRFVNALQRTVPWLVGVAAGGHAGATVVPLLPSPAAGGPTARGLLDAVRRMLVLRAYAAAGRLDRHVADERMVRVAGGVGAQQLTEATVSKTAGDCLLGHLRRPASRCLA